MPEKSKRKFSENLTNAVRHARRLRAFQHRAWALLSHSGALAIERALLV
jgi:hypothetical protein